MNKEIKEIRDISRTFSNLGKSVLVVTESSEFYQSMKDFKVDHLADISLYTRGRSYQRYEVVISVGIDDSELSFILDGKGVCYTVVAHLATKTLE